jgi:hypothetical protein
MTGGGCGWLRRAVATVAAIAVLLPCSVIRAQSAQTDIRVTVLTFGPGDVVWERFGHNALRIVYPSAGIDIAYNWGMFDFNQPNFLGRFLSGDTKYWVEAFQSQPLIDFYISHDRSAVEQELNLTADQRLRLAAAVAESALEANRYYRYDYFRDNCSTRLRDAIDDVLGGALRRRFEPIRTEWTYRNESIRLTGPTYYSQLGIELALGPRADAPLSAWDAMFIPMHLRDLLREVTIPAPDGGTMPLVLEERVLHTPVVRPAEPETRRGLTLGALGPVLGIWTLMLIPLGADARRKRRIPAAAMTAVFYGLTGLIGTIILLMWVGSAHVFWYTNATLLLCSPLALVAAVVGTRAVWSGELSRLAMASVGVVAGSALLALLIAPFVTQRMSGPLMFLLPAHIGLAVAIWRHTRPVAEPAP